VRRCQHRPGVARDRHRFDLGRAYARNAVAEVDVCGVRRAKKRRAHHDQLRRA